MNPSLDTEIRKATAQVVSQTHNMLSGYGGGEMTSFLMGVMASQNGQFGGNDFRPVIKAYEDGPMRVANARAKWLRHNVRATTFPSFADLVKASNGSISKAALDVGLTTNFPNITGGQALGYVSLDTQLARGTVRPNSFTLYQMLSKTPANQVVDYWAYSDSTGGAAPGAAYASYGSQTSGTLTINSGLYDFKYCTLRLAVDGRAITMALAQQNSYLNIGEQETANAALSILQTVDWAIYWGNPSLWPNQVQGIAGLLPTKNIENFQTWKTSQAALGLSDVQLLFNLIYDEAAFITKYGQFGQITHAFMPPTTAASLNSLVTGILNNIVNPKIGESRAIVVNGDVQGMQTRFGPIAFPIDLFITAREIPVSAIVFDNGTTLATTVNPTPPASVTVTASGAAYTGSQFTTAWVASSAQYVYAVASTDAAMNESVLTLSGQASGISAGSAYSLAIVPPSDHTAIVFRVFRSGLGTLVAGGPGATAPTANAFRWIGDIAANVGATITYIDLNAKIPGSDTIFLLDLDENDMALDYRWLLPLSKIELYAQNLFMPWAVAHIGTPRLRIPKFNGMITNYVPPEPDWNPLGAQY
jgi:hypothetical protein